MTAQEAYKAIKSRQLRQRDRAWADGWRLPEYHGSAVVMRNSKTGEAATGTRRLRKDGEWSKRVTFAA